MAFFYLHDPASNTWRGPFDEAEIRQHVANGYIEPSRQVWSGQAGDAPIAAFSLPAPGNDRVPDWLKLLGLGVAVVGGAWLLGEALKPKGAARSDSPRSRNFYSSPEDPEQVAIRRTAKRHVKNGAEVFADIPGWPRPPKLNGHIPDVFAVYEDREFAVEFENRSSVGRTHARRQDAAFSSWADESPNRDYEQIVVRNGRGGRG
jgi:hypothetical protein